MVIVVPKVEKKLRKFRVTNPATAKPPLAKAEYNAATIKGVGESAEAIIEYRKKRGSSKPRKDLMKVRGIGKEVSSESFQERIVTQ